MVAMGPAHVDEVDVGPELVAALTLIVAGDENRGDLLFLTLQRRHPREVADWLFGRAIGDVYAQARAEGVEPSEILHVLGIRTAQAAMGIAP